MNELEDDDFEEEDAITGSRVPVVFRGTSKLAVKTAGTRSGAKVLVRYTVWNTITPCRQDECPIFDDCPYEEKLKKGGKCKVEQSYINSVATMVYRNFRSKFTEDQFFIVGMHILPLYRHLCRLKIWEWSVREVMYETEKGTRHINPIYREVREQIKAISGQWRMLGIGKFEIMEPRNPWGPAGKPEKESLAYYDRLGEIEPMEDKPFNRDNNLVPLRRR